jgi:hypothetical protein
MKAKTLCTLLVATVLIGCGCGNSPKTSSFHVVVGLDNSASSRKEMDLYRQVLFAFLRGHRYNKPTMTIDWFVNEPQPVFSHDAPYPPQDEQAAFFETIKATPVSTEQGTYFAHELDRLRAKCKEKYPQTVHCLLLSDGGVDDPMDATAAATELAKEPNLGKIILMPVTNRENTFNKTQKILSPLGDHLVMATKEEALRVMTEEVIPATGGVR